MGIKTKQIQLRQKALYEQELKDRLSFLSGRGIEPPKVDKDTIVRKLKAGIRAVDHRLRRLAENEKRTEEMARIKAERAAAPAKEKEEAKAPKAKKAPEGAKVKKPKPEKKAAPAKAPVQPEGGPKTEK
jgi:hypothetical protein